MLSLQDDLEANPPSSQEEDLSDASSQEEETESDTSADREGDSTAASSREDPSELFLAGHGNDRGLTALIIHNDFGFVGTVDCYSGADS